MPNEIVFSKITHEFRYQPDNRTERKVLRAEILIGQHRFYEEVDDDDQAFATIRAKAEQLKANLDALTR